MPVPLGTEPNNYRVLLLIQLSPYGLFQITRQNQMEFADERLALADIDPELFRMLHQAFVKSKDIFELVNDCDRILHSRLERSVVSDALLLATSVIETSHGQEKVKEIARKSCYSERHLNRLFLTQIGMSTKNYARLTRFNYVLENIRKSPCFFAALSQEAEHFDGYWRACDL